MTPFPALLPSHWFFGIFTRAAAADMRRECGN